MAAVPSPTRFVGKKWALTAQRPSKVKATMSSLDFNGTLQKPTFPKQILLLQHCLVLNWTSLQGFNASV